MSAAEQELAEARAVYVAEQDKAAKLKRAAESADSLEAAARQAIVALQATRQYLELLAQHRRLPGSAEKVQTYHDASCARISSLLERLQIAISDEPTTVEGDDDGGDAVQPQSTEGSANSSEISSVVEDDSRSSDAEEESAPSGDEEEEQQGDDPKIGSTALKDMDVAQLQGVLEDRLGDSDAAALFAAQSSERWTSKEDLIVMVREHMCHRKHARSGEPSTGELPESQKHKPEE